jgi:hypothetical protein
MRDRFLALGREDPTPGAQECSPAYPQAVLPDPQTPEGTPRPARDLTRIMYIEDKTRGLNGPARIGRVTFTRTGRSVRYRGRLLRRVQGFKHNFEDEATGEAFWISGPHKDGRDRNYGGRLPIEIDEDVRAEYWTTIRGLPEHSDRARA